MFKRTKRRDESTYLDIENGEVITSKISENKKINVRKCDDFSEDELNNIENNIEIEIKNGLPICEPVYNENLEEDKTVSDMKATIFNIFKFIFIFCFIAIIGFIMLKIGPSLIYTFKNISNTKEINTTEVTDKEVVNNDLNFLEKQKIEKEKKKLIETMNNMNIINEEIKENWTLLQSYCLGYSNNTYTIYTHNKNIKSLDTQFTNNYLTFLNTEQSFELSYDKELFEIYKNRYQNLIDCISMLKDNNLYNRSTIIEQLNDYVLIDNEYNKKEFDILIENFNNYNLNYTITDEKIILN